MITNFLEINQNTITLLVKGMETYLGILVSMGKGWIVEGQYFETSQVSICGYADKPYVVVF